MEGLGGIGFFPKAVLPFLAQLPPKDVQPSVLILDTMRFGSEGKMLQNVFFSVTSSESRDTKSEGFCFVLFCLGHAAGILVP